MKILQIQPWPWWIKRRRRRFFHSPPHLPVSFFILFFRNSREMTLFFLPPYQCFIEKIQGMRQRNERGVSKDSSGEFCFLSEPIKWKEDEFYPLMLLDDMRIKGTVCPFSWNTTANNYLFLFYHLDNPPLLSMTGTLLCSNPCCGDETISLDNSSEHDP